MKYQNKKGFVLLETLIVTIFTLIIFTVLYTSVVPLLGRYDSLSYYNDLDTTYDLYYLKKMLLADSNYESISNLDYKNITCGSLNDIETCQDYFKSLDINPTTGDEVIYLDLSKLNNYVNNLSDDVKDYVQYIDKKFKEDKPIKILILKRNSYLSYITWDKYVPLPPTITFSASGTPRSSGYEKGLVVTVTCKSDEGMKSLNTSGGSVASSITTSSDGYTQTRTVTFNDAGSNKNLTVNCTAINDMVATSSKTYSIYEYSRDSSCNCETYNCSCTCKYEVSSGICTGTSSKSTTGSSCSSACSTKCSNSLGSSYCGYKYSTGSCSQRKKCWHT